MAEEEGLLLESDFCNILLFFFLSQDFFLKRYYRVGFFETLFVWARKLLEVYVEVLAVL